MMYEMRQSAEDAGYPVKLLTTREVVELIKVDKSTVYRMAENGRIPAVKVGRQWRFPEDRLLEWLGRRTPGEGSSSAPSAAGLRDLLSPQSAEALGALFGELLGVMILVTDMGGRPLGGAGNPCGLFTAAHAYPGVMEQCVAGWRDMADAPDLEAQWKPTPLGFLCARSLIRVGNELQGMVMAGGVAPATWPPDDERLELLATSLGLPADLIASHADEVYSLGPAAQERVLRLLPQLGTLISRLAADRRHPDVAAVPGRVESTPEVQRREQ